jgi:LacI family transcriptional regulator
MRPTTRKTTIVDIADALDTSIATVHRALRDHPNIKHATKERVLNMAKKLAYKPNLAARYLSSKKTIRISVNTLEGTTSFWDEVRAGIVEESQSLDLENVELEFRNYPQLGDSEEAAFKTALEEKVDGIIAFPSNPRNLKRLMLAPPGKTTPVVFVATDAPGLRSLAVVAIDSKASGFLAADLMGRILGGKGRVAVTMFDAAITEHAEKADAFKKTMESFHLEIIVEDAIEDRDIDAVAYKRICDLITAYPDLAGIYVTTEASMPVLRAARDLLALQRLTIITTDLFPSLIDEIKCGNVTASIYQRPRTQGEMAFRALYEFLVEDAYPARRITLAPHLVMRGNVDSFLQEK